MHWNRWMAPALALTLVLGACHRRPKGPVTAFPGQPSTPRSGSAAVSPEGTIVTPAQPRIGRVTLVNSSARYVIVTYAVGTVPGRDSRLSVYRAGLKVAELRVSDFARDLNAAADIVAGECQVGDEVREN